MTVDQVLDSCFDAGFCDSPRDVICRGCGCVVRVERRALHLFAIHFPHPHGQPWPPDWARKPGEAPGSDPGAVCSRCPAAPEMTT
jgi:hypothetical protein